MAIIPYDRITNLQNDQALAPSDPYPAPKLDQEYNAIKITTDDIIQHLDLIQRDDGQLENDSVGLDQLREEVSVGFNAPAPWETGHDYIVGDTVFQDNAFWYCQVAHEATVFADDYAAGYWYLIANFTDASSTGAKMFVSDGPPVTATHGQQWFESDTGNTFVFYVDSGGGPGQWVHFNSGAGTAGGDLDGSSFTQAGAGAVTRTMQDKARETVSVMDFGARGTGAVDDTAAIQAAINHIISVGGGTVFFPSAPLHYTTTAPLVIDISAITTRLGCIVQLVGAGVGRSKIANGTLAGPVLRFNGTKINSAIENHFQVRDLQITGATVAGSIGLQVTMAAYAVLRNVLIEGMDLGFSGTDIEQAGFHDCGFKYNNRGMLFNGAAAPPDGVTDTNSITFVNTNISGNATYGALVTRANAFSWLGGSVQYNGVIGGGAGQFGLKFVDAGVAGGYGTVLFSGMIFEGNGGLAQFVSEQVTAGAFGVFTFSSTSFERTLVGPKGYGVNEVNISGTQAARYNLKGCAFRSGATYPVSAARPCIANTNAAAAVYLDDSTLFQNTAEASQTQVLQLGSVGQAHGVFYLAGLTSGIATILTPAVAGNPVLTTPLQSGTLVSTGHAAAAKKWAMWTSAGALGSSFGVSSVDRLGVGHWRVNLSPAMANAAYAISITSGMGGGGFALAYGINVVTTTSFEVFTMLSSAVTDPTIPDYITCTVFGT